MSRTRYAKSGEFAIGYQVAGDGPLDLVLVPGVISHVEFGSFACLSRPLDPARTLEYTHLSMAVRRDQQLDLLGLLLIGAGEGIHGL